MNEEKNKVEAVLFTTGRFVTLEELSKMSGIGSKAGGPDYLLQFMLPRTVTENTLRRGFAPSAEKL